MCAEDFQGMAFRCFKLFVCCGALPSLQNPQVPSARVSARPFPRLLHAPVGFSGGISPRFQEASVGTEHVRSSSRTFVTFFKRLGAAMEVVLPRLPPAATPRSARWRACTEPIAMPFGDFSGALVLE